MSEAAQQTLTGGSEKPKTFAAKAYWSASPTAKMGPASIQRRAPQPKDVKIESSIAACATRPAPGAQRMAHMIPRLPVVPGHEIVGRVAKVGKHGEEVQSGRSGRRGLHGRFLRRLRKLPGRAEHTAKNSPLSPTTAEPILGGVTYGGYSESIVVDEGSR